MKFYTIGYGGRSPDTFLKLLIDAGVKCLVDVRLRPDKASMGSYVKAKSSDKGIEALLAQGDIQYISLTELGNLFLDWDDWQQAYQELIDKVGPLLTKRIAKLPQPFCLMCAEKRVAECHRKIIADYLVTLGHEVEHIE